jgi:hypothetical protein
MNTQTFALGDKVTWLFSVTPNGDVTEFPATVTGFEGERVVIKVYDSHYAEYFWRKVTPDKLRPVGQTAAA